MCVCVCVCESTDEVSMVIFSICIDLNVTLIYRVFLCNSLIFVRATIHHSNVFFPAASPINHTAKILQMCRKLSDFLNVCTFLCSW